MSSAVPSADELSAAFDESGGTILELLLFGMSMVSLGIWIGTEFAWRASFALSRAALGGVPDVALFSSIMLLVLMGLVGWVDNE